MIDEPVTDKQKGFLKTLGYQGGYDVTKKEAIGIISKLKGEPAQGPKVSNAIPSDKAPAHAMMLTSYAKDVFIAKYEKLSTDSTEVDTKYLMDNAIDLVKQAREAFS